MPDTTPSTTPPAGGPPARMPTVAKPASDTGGLFRGRPYGPANIFVVTFSGAANEAHDIWVPDNAYWELGLLRIKGTAAADFAVADTKQESLVGMIDCDGITYSDLDLGLAALRSQSPINARLVLVDIVGVANTVKGVAYGWQVSREGFYR